MNERAIEFNDQFLPHDGSSKHTTALHEAVKGRHVSTAQLLLEAGGRVEAEALYLAVSKGDLPMVWHPAQGEAQGGEGAGPGGAPPDPCELGKSTPLEL